MKIQEVIREFVQPSEAFRTQTFYHGTGTTAQAQQILQQGINPGNVTGKARGHLTPVSGAVYLTPNLRYAIIYAIGGDMIGHQENEYLIKKAGGDPYGYVFVIPGDRLNMIQPDEDSVGAAVHYAYDIIEKGAKGQPYYGDNQLYANMLLPENRAWVTEFLRLARYGMTPRQFRAAIDGFIAAQAAGGKRFLKLLSSSKNYEGMKLKLIKMGAHVAHSGPIVPTQCWRIDRRRNPELQKDGSNFFQVAERIPIQEAMQVGIPRRPDNRPPEVVWHWFEVEFSKGDFPNVSWALGSDWGMGSAPLNAEQYKARAYARMAELYGPKPAR